uniref:Uncharacterized protein n=1 Tax=Leersia perrieri TaxID=77586 RepID=A0A0D9W4T3_9ORYZ
MAQMPWNRRGARLRSPAAVVAPRSLRCCCLGFEDERSCGHPPPPLPRAVAQRPRPRRPHARSCRCRCKR